MSTNPKNTQKSSVGPDGLTKHQRYYQKNQDRIKASNKARRRRATDGSRGSASSTQVTEGRRYANQATQTDVAANLAYQNFWNNPPQKSNSLELMLQEDIDSKLKELPKFTEVRGFVLEWCSIWGGVTLWEDTMEHAFQKYKEEKDWDAFEQWIAFIWKHADRGRKILQRVEGLETRLTGHQSPCTEYFIRALWRCQLTMLKPLIEGIAILEARIGFFHWRMIAMELGVFDFKALLLDLIGQI
ncbi:hypothetical protein GALMADRAFT_148283 [Galerina marginata CBS 339.88]|uniref:Uncharacterized protein n=1 Tax=Galerina marginata (strain CBS 339.88) TaxID=685588 RepID=A0A067SGM9_GALM3|nr:hypothetical protein GALMADRAFT_148283 [Galerina marginata CBS 339.88]